MKNKCKCKCKDWEVESIEIKIPKSKNKIRRVQQVCRSCGNVVHLYDEKI